MRRLPIPELALVGIAAVWGLTFVMVQDAVEILPVTAFLAYRFIPASILVAVVFRKQLRSLSAAGWRMGLLMGLFLTGGYLFQTFGLERTSASNAGFITGMFVVLTPLLGALLLRQKAGAPAWVAAVVSTIGLYLLSRTGRQSDLHLDGDALVFGCACCFALHILATDIAVKRFNIGALLAVQLGVCGFFSLIAAAAAGELEVPRAGSVWLALAVTSLVASAAGFFVQTYAQQHAPPARTALILASEPAFAGFFAYVLADQTLEGLAWLGAGLILAAIVTVELFPYLRPTRPLPEG